MEANNLMIDAESMALNNGTKKEFHDIFQLFVNEVRYVLIKINRFYILLFFSHLFSLRFVRAVVWANLFNSVQIAQSPAWLGACAFDNKWQFSWRAFFFFLFFALSHLRQIQFYFAQMICKDWCAAHRQHRHSTRKNHEEEEGKVKNKKKVRSERMCECARAQAIRRRRSLWQFTWLRRF